MVPSFATAIRFVAVLGVEWSTLTLLEPSPAWIKIGTLVLGVVALAILEFRPWLDKQWRYAFVAAMTALLVVFAGILSVAFHGTAVTVLWSALPWLLAAFGCLGIAIAIYQTIKPEKSSDPALAAQTIDGQSHLDLVHLLDFAVNQTTILWLFDLILKTPEVAVVPMKIDGDAQAAKMAGDFVRHVSIQLGQDTLRQQIFLSLMAQTESEAERRVEEMPADKRPEGIDPLVLRRCAIAILQANRAFDFLHREKREVEQRLIGQRSRLIEQLRFRSPN